MPGTFLSKSEPGVVQVVQQKKHKQGEHKMKKRFDVIVGQKSADGTKTYWTKIGSAWEREKDGGMSVKLSALPIGNELLIVEAKTEGQKEAAF